MENNEFFILRATFKRSQVRIEPLADYEHNYLQDDSSVLIENNKFRVDEGKKWFDIIRFQDISNFAISEKVKNLLEEHHITGWGCYPIDIEGYQDKKYYGFQVLSQKAGKILNLEAVNNYEEEISKFDIKTWDGSDIFSLEATILTVFTPKVKELFDKAKITNVEFDASIVGV